MSVINSKLQINYILSNIINTTFWYNSKKLKTPVNFLQTQYDKVSWIKSGCLDLEPLIVLLIADCAPPYILYPPYKMYWIRNRPSPRKGKRKKMKKQIFFLHLSTFWQWDSIVSKSSKERIVRFVKFHY